MLGVAVGLANWKRSEHHSRGASLEGAVQRAIRSELRERALGLLKATALLLIVAVAVGLLVLSTLALVELN
jgi:hypothetical protein